MGPVRQISEIRTEAFTINKREKFGKTRTAYCENFCVVFVYNLENSKMLTDLSIVLSFT